MSLCKITAGVTIDCDDLRRLGGLNTRFWIYAPTDAVAGAPSIEGYIEALTFTTGTNTFAFESPDNSCSAGWEAVAAEGGNKFFNHTVAIKLAATTPADDEALEEMLVAKMAVIVETQNHT